MRAIKSVLIVVFIVAAATTSIPAYAAEDNLYPGTNCMAANLSQGRLFSWNRNGLTNNFSNDLFVICPISFDRNEWDISPVLLVEVTIWMPPGYTNAIDGSVTGPPCTVRFFRPNIAVLDATGDQVVIANSSFNVGAFNGGSAVGNVDTDGISVNADAAEDSNAHLLCLVPPGGTLQHYRAAQL